MSGAAFVLAYPSGLGLYPYLVSGGIYAGVCAYHVPADAGERVQSMPDRADNFARLEALAGLKEDWNGEGAGAFSPGLIACVRMLLCVVTLQPELYPTARGSVQLEYHRPDGGYLEFEVYESGEVTALLELDGQARSWRVQKGHAEMNRVIGVFYGHG